MSIINRKYYRCPVCGNEFESKRKPLFMHSIRVTITVDGVTVLGKWRNHICAKCAYKLFGDVPWQLKGNGIYELFRKMHDEEKFMPKES